MALDNKKYGTTAGLLLAVFRCKFKLLKIMKTQQTNNEESKRRDTAVSCYCVLTLLLYCIRFVLLYWSQNGHVINYK